MNPAVLTSILGALSSLIVAIVSIYLNNRLIGYRIDQLEKKVEKHNNVVERVTMMEKTIPEKFATVWNRYDDMKDDINKNENSIQRVENEIHSGKGD